MEGIDRTRKVELDADYLARTNPYGAPAIEHPYAVTTYCAQGATVDRAYVMADPSMDRQELYVAASRSREALAGRIVEARERLAGFAAQHEAAQGMGRRERGDELARIAAFEAHSREALARMEEALREMPAAQHAAREELAVVEGLLGGRRQLAVTAARLAPPDYITAALGERPSDPTKRRSWESGVELIEGYRQEHGISDRDKAPGAEPEKPFERAARERRENRLRQIRLQLGHEHAIELDHSLGIGM